MHLRLIRNATLRLELGGRQLIVDPMLDPPGARPAVAGTENDRRNPLVALPEPAEVVIAGLDAALVTHLHQDHFDTTAAAMLPRDLPLFCQPEDMERLAAQGFKDLRPVAGQAEFEGIRIIRVPARHGYGADAEALAPVSGFVLRDPGGRTVYLAGDTVLYEEVEETLARERPDVVVVNASGARFAGGKPIVMTSRDVVTVARLAPEARIVAVHLEAINHCIETRADLHQCLHEEGLTQRVTVPEDGAAVPVD
jgi:L-ascorbate metabolism protein UlaG (beta-lactamase superfamily)